MMLTFIDITVISSHMQIASHVFQNAFEPLKQNLVTSFPSTRFLSLRSPFSRTTTSNRTTNSMSMDIGLHEDRKDLDIPAIDRRLADRQIELDPTGYFLIFVIRAERLICAKFVPYMPNENSNSESNGNGKEKTKADLVETVFMARTAKELSIEIFEKAIVCPVSRLDHAVYLGREFVRAELALVLGQDYVQE